MKKIYRLSLLGVLFIFAACRKNENVLTPDMTGANDQASLAATGNKPLTVKTYAGSRKSGYKDGPIKEALFDILHGIDIVDDGTIYVADFRNGKIRRISTDGIVSTVNISPNSEGHTLYGPNRVRVQKDGTLSILTYDINHIILDKIWIVKPNGQVFTPPKKGPLPGDSPTSYNPYTYNDLEKDPYTDKVLVGGIYVGYSGAMGLLENYEIKNGFIGTNPYYIPADSLNAEDKNSREITGFFCGYNKVKYIVINGKHIYKQTPSGVFTQIYRNLEFIRISSLVATKDSRSIYVADLGKIKVITNNKLTYLVGPHLPHDRGDGIGSSADVYADQLALGKNESILYFTDGNTVRQLFLN